MFSDGLSLCPFLFDGVEVGGIRWQEEQCMACVLYHVLGILPFVERGIVHNNHRFFRQFRQQILRHPCRKDIGINVGREQSNCKQGFADQSANGIGSPRRVPVTKSVAARPDGSVTVCAGHVVGKSALVNVDNRASAMIVPFNNRLEDTPCAFASLWVRQAFFYS